jgi:hypothetical protein
MTQVSDTMPGEYLRYLDASGLAPGELSRQGARLSSSAILPRGPDFVTARDWWCAACPTLFWRPNGGEHNGENAFIPRITMTPSGNTNEFSFIFSRLQFPVRRAFAISINRAQGQSVKYVGIDLRMPIFTHGQL